MPSERSDRSLYHRVLAALVITIGTLALVSVGGFQALSAARAYVGGESLWSKARSQTVAKLRARIAGRTTRCPALAEALAVPFGDRAARLALERSPPDLAEARAGFLRGGNSADDLNGMIGLYLGFGSTPMLRETVAAWRRGDDLIEQLRQLGERVCTAAIPDADHPIDQDAMRELDRLEAALIDTETRFSASLGDASRLTGRLLSAAIALLALLLAWGSAWYLLHSLRAQVGQRRALVDANARWELAAAAADVGLFAWQPGSDTIELDDRARRLSGLEPDPGVPVEPADLQARMHPDDRDEFQRQQQVAMGPGGTLRARYRVLGDDGAVRHIEAVGTFRDNAPALGEPQMFGVLRDVTDEIAAARLQIERDAAQRSAQARSEFLSRLSHELRTPLNAVLGLAQLLKLDRNEPLTTVQHRRVALMLDSGRHLLHLVDDVLDITRIDSGKLALTTGPADLRAVLRASVAAIEPERSRLQIRIDDRWPVKTPAAMADPKRLQQVFVNLLSNACKYNRRGGSLTLTFEETRDALRLGFADEGPGIEPAQLTELFQPFKRLARTADVPGTGLGLVVVKLLLEQMRGGIEVASEPGRGARFTVWLRKAGADAPA